MLKIAGLSGVFGILLLLSAVSLATNDLLRHAMMIWAESSLRSINDSRAYLVVQIAVVGDTSAVRDIGR